MPYPGPMKRLAVFIFLIALSPAAHSQTSATPELLTQVRQSVQTELNALNADLTQLAGDLGARAGGDLATLTDRDVRAGLKSILKRNPIVIDASLVTSHGMLAKVEPAKYRASEGQTIADQPQFVQLRATGKAVLGPQMRMIEGLEAMDLEVPILGKGGQFIGSVSAIFDARKLIGRYQDSLLKNMPFRLTLLQTDGRVLFSSFGDPIFQNIRDGVAKGSASVRSVVNRILAESNGEAIFDQNSADTSDDHAAYWVSVGLHGRELRLVLLSDAGRTVPVKSVSAATALRDLQKLAASADVIAGMAAADADTLDDALIRFLQSNPSVYSVQAITAKGFVFAGQPIGGAPVGYRLSAKRPGDQAALRVLATGQAAQTEGTLLEGGRALFTIVPIKGGALMGIIRYRN